MLQQPETWLICNGDCKISCTEYSSCLSEDKHPSIGRLHMMPISIRWDRSRVIGQYACISMFRQLNIFAAKWNVTWWQTDSQWSSCNTAVMWSNFLAPIVTHILIICRFRSRSSPMPYNILLQQSRWLLRNVWTSIFVDSHHNHSAVCWKVTKKLCTNA